MTRVITATGGQSAEARDAGGHRLRAVQVAGGFMGGLTLHLDGGLNCLIGARGTGKTTILELVRYALDALPPGDDCERQRIETLVRTNLGDGTVELIIETREGLTYRVMRAWHDDPVVVTADGAPTEISLRSGGVFRADIYSQNEVERIANRALSQLSLIDNFEAVQIAQITAELRTLTSRLATSATSLMPLQHQITALNDEIAGLPGIEEKLKALGPITGRNAEEVTKAQQAKSLRQRETQALNGLWQFVQEYDQQLAGAGGRIAGRTTQWVTSDMLAGPNGRVITEIKRMLLDAEAGGTITPRYVEFIDGKKVIQRNPSGTSITLTAGQTYAIQAVMKQQYPTYAVRLYVDRNQDGDFGEGNELVLTNYYIFGTFDGGHVGLYRATSSDTTTLQWDNFICGYDADSDDDIGTVASQDAGDYIYAAYNFDGGDWQEITYAHDDNGNLTGDGLFKYTYDAWNRLVGVWHDACSVDGNGVPNVEAERVARYAYDGLFRRIEKEIANQGTGFVFHSDDDDVTPIQAGERQEHYYYAGWRLIETTNHVEVSEAYSYDDSNVLNQFVWGTQYIDEPVRYDRDLDADNDCIDTDEGGSAAYYYHQDVNWRVVMLTDEDGQAVERTEYTAYGEPTLYGGYDSTAGDELGNALLVSTVGNPFMHQGLFRDRETRTYQNRFRQYHSGSGRFMQRDRWGYIDSMSLYEVMRSDPVSLLDPLGLEVKVGGSSTARKRIECLLKKLCPGASVDKKTGDVSIDSNHEDASAPGCKKLQKLIDDDEKHVIIFGRDEKMRRSGSPGRYDRDAKPKKIRIVTKKYKIKTLDGDKRNVEPWEVLWHEITHAEHDVDGKYTDDAKEEVRTIEEMNELRDWYNDNNPPNEPEVTNRDPETHYY